MGLLPITLIGDKILRKKAAEVEEVDIKTIELIKNMFDTMHNANGIGLAANQVGSNKSIFVVDMSVLEEYKDHNPLVFINPRIINRSDETAFVEEGCLSIPDIRGEVERPKSVTVAYQNTDLKEKTMDADDFLARVIQHEYDHLQGVLFTDLISDEMKKKVKNDILKIKKRKWEFQYPVTEDVDYQMI